VKRHLNLDIDIKLTLHYILRHPVEYYRNHYQTHITVRMTTLRIKWSIIVMRHARRCGLLSQRSPANTGHLTSLAEMVGSVISRHGDMTCLMTGALCCLQLMGALTDGSQPAVLTVVIWSTP